MADAYEPGRGFRHIVGGDGTVAGLLDDQVHMARALLDAYEHTGSDRYLGVAADVMDYVLSEFGAPGGAFYDVAGGEARGPQGLAVAYVPVQDTPTPSGNAVAILVLDRLAVLTGRARYGDAADRALRACAPGTTDQGLFAATLALALDLHLERRRTWSWSAHAGTRGPNRFTPPPSPPTGTAPWRISTIRQTPAAVCRRPRPRWRPPRTPRARTSARPPRARLRQRTRGHSRPRSAHSAARRPRSRPARA